MTRWEYKTVEDSAAAFVRDRGDGILDLNELGAEGWEAVGVGVHGTKVGTTSVVVLLKRPIP